MLANDSRQTPFFAGGQLLATAIEVSLMPADYFNTLIYRANRPSCEKAQSG